MKSIKFRNYLVPLVLSGEKNVTWRLFDDKNLSIGDEIELIEFGTYKSFAQAKITKVVVKSFENLTKEDKIGHEEFSNDEDMYRTYSKYYKTEIGPESELKIVWFDLTKKF
jgi:hypothetical protein